MWNVDRGFGELEVDSDEHREHEWAVRAGRYPDETLWEWEKTEVAKLSKRVRENQVGREDCRCAVTQ